MAYLGIDQSLTGTGVALISQSGALLSATTVRPKKLRGAQRLVFIRDAVRNFVALATEPVHCAAMEGYAYDVNGNNMFELGEAGGVMKVLVSDMLPTAPLLVVAPASLKKFVTGNGAAGKAEVCAFIYRLWSVDFDSEKENDRADAFGLAQVARAYHQNVGRTRAQLEVIKLLRKSG